MKKTILAGIAGAAIAAGLGLAAPAQANPNCVINSPDDNVSGNNGICGIPDLQASVDASLANLKANLNPITALQNLKDNANVVSGPNNLSNLKYALKNGVGSEG